MPREAKSRRIEREYMADREFMTMFTAEEREFYILLSLYSDDAGWLDWDPAELAASLYRYEHLDARENKVETFAEHLKSTGRLRVFRCGHAVMPRVAKRPRGQAREYAVQRAHEEHSKSRPVHSPPNLAEPNLTYPHLPARARTREGRSAAGNGMTPLAQIPFKDLVPPPQAKKS